MGHNPRYNDSVESRDENPNTPKASSWERILSQMRRHSTKPSANRPALGFCMEGRMKQADPFYKTKRWERMRESVLRRDGYMCRESARYGKRKSANTVHHIFPRDIFPEYQWEPWNLISLAGDVHDEMHDRQTGALTEKGMEWVRRTARRRGMEIPRRYAE